MIDTWGFRSGLFAVSAVLASLLDASWVRAAEPTALEDDQLVATYTTLVQRFPRVDVSDSGAFTVVWESWSPDGSGASVRAQRRTAAGEPIGGEFQANTYTPSSQSTPSVAVAGGGDFVVVWASYGQDGSGSGIFGQRFDATGLRVGAEFRAGARSNGDQDLPDVGIAADGSFVVVWEDGDYFQSGVDGSAIGVVARRFNAQGAAIGGDIIVNDMREGVQRDAEVAVAPSGRFVVVWSGEVLAESDYDIRAQAFAADGSRVGSEFSVNATVGRFEAEGAIAASDAGFVVVWSAFGVDGNGYGVAGRRLDADGAPLAGDFVVNAYTTGKQMMPSVAIEPDGGFVVAWQSDGGRDGDDKSVHARRFAADATPMGGEFQLNTTTAGGQRFPRVAASATGRILAAWDVQPAFDNADVRVRGFTSGDPGDCGNLTVDAGEACDGGECCTDNCEFVAVGTACTEDSDICTDTICDGEGVCVAVANTAPCDDGLFCTVGDACSEGLCIGAPRDCDDGVGCTIDVCDEDAVECVSTADDALCDDTLYCNGVETCDVVLDCQAGQAVVCDDGVDCTVDACDEDTDACGATADDAFCDDSVFCNGAEVCDLTNDCQAGTPPTCDDGVGCTVDACDSESDACVATPDDAACDDGAFCNGDEFCDLTNDCEAGTAPVCDDGVDCTTDACDEDADACAATADDMACDDGIECTAESCDLVEGCVVDAGACNDCGDGFQGMAEECDDGNSAALDGCDGSCVVEDMAGAEVEAQGMVTTDTGAGTSVEDPLTVKLTSPVAGTVKIIETTSTSSAPAGFAIFGPDVVVTAPAASAEAPIELRFTVHSSLLPAELGEAVVQILRDGAALPGCATTAPASPDPCVASETADENGREVVVVTSAASVWNLARLSRACGDATLDGAISATDALTILRASIGLSPCRLVYCDADASGRVLATDALKVLQKSVNLPVELTCAARG